ncbi:MAG TPA: hypothetical protein DD727_05805, partial [Clostridiales bacterium]|nr:hypothetical protein [Clostridiales bacterium]
MKLDNKFKKVFAGHKKEDNNEGSQPMPCGTSSPGTADSQPPVPETVQPVPEVEQKKEQIIERPVPRTYEGIRDEIRTYLANALSLPLSHIHDHSRFIDDLGGDSLQSLELFSKIEDRYHILIPDEEYFTCSRIQDIVNLIYGKVSGKTKPPEELDHSIDSQNKGAEPCEDKKVLKIARFEDSREHEAFSRRLELAAEAAAAMGTEFENPYFVPHDSVLRDVSIIDGQEVLNFASYNYLGLSGHPATVQAACEAAARYGTSASGSRLLTGEKTLFKELEREIACWKHSEDALVLVGGHSTNVTVVGNFCNQNDLILYDGLSHNSIIQGTLLSKSASKHFPHNDFAALERMLADYRDRYEKVLIVVEGVYSMDGDIAPIPEFVRLKKKYGCFLMVDEAHSSCVIGPHAWGVDDYFNLEPEDIDIRMGTLSKGLGACGGYIAGKKCMIDYMRYNIPGFVFSVGISPPVAAAALAAVKLVRTDFSMAKRLQANINTFISEARARDINTCLAKETAIIPVLVGKDDH